jgi:hypothetical protein
MPVQEAQFKALFVERGSHEEGCVAAVAHRRPSLVFGAVYESQAQSLGRFTQPRVVTARSIIDKEFSGLPSVTPQQCTNVPSITGFGRKALIIPPADNSGERRERRRLVAEVITR